MVKCETIAVTEGQAKKLRAAAKDRAKRCKKKLVEYFAAVPGRVPNRTDTKSACVQHRLVRVACGLRKAANITHISKGRVRFGGGDSPGAPAPKRGRLLCATLAAGH